MIRPKNFLQLLLLVLLMMSGCNSDYANLDRISHRATFVTQLGSLTKLSGFSNSGQDFCRDIAVDYYENIFCFGVTNSSMARTNNGAVDAFVAKLNRHGELQWIKQFGTPGIDGCRGGAVDSFGNIYCGGTTNGLLDPNPVIQVANTPTQRLPGATDTDAFVAKLDPNGNILWIKQFGSAGNDTCNNIAVSPLGNAYCGASTNDVIGYSPNGVISQIGSTTNDAYMAKISPEGVLLWTRQLDGYYNANRNWDEGCYGVAIDDEENVYCGGSTNGSLLLGNGAGSNGSTYDVFIWVLNKDGLPVFAQQLGGGTTHPNLIAVNAGEECNDIAVDKDKNIYCTGKASATSFAENAAGGEDMILIKWNSNFTIDWMRQLGTTTRLSGLNTGDQIAEGVTVAPDGTILIVGHTTSHTAKNNVGGKDMLFVTFDQDGNLTGGEQIGTVSDDQCISPKFDSEKKVYCAGSTFGGLGEGNAGSEDAAIVRFEKLLDF